ncbi:MAG TPA: sulfotransferase [Candidatus Sulfotelmatobacter sp.]|jgi:hypothetical protein|nr:sulfotransferase [Candidatus Sulfotelmatobacter sp.]
MTHVDQNPAPQSAFKGPLFVVGMWRSGTSLLYALLNQHPNIALMYEGDLPLLWPLFLGGKAKSDWLERWEFWNGALSRHQIARGRIPADISSLSAAVELAYRQHAGEAIWGCKSPSYYDAMTHLAQQFPKARFVVIYRNPADICRSIVRAGRKASWFSRSGMPLRALLGYREMKKQTDHLLSAGAQVHTLQYEELVSEPERELRRICEFLEIPFEPRMTSLADAKRSAIYEADHHAMVKSTQIRPLGPREEVLPAALLQKILRNTHLWRKQSGGTWPLYCEPLAADAQIPGWLEQFTDSLLYRAYRAFDRAIVPIYCFAPLALLRMYRGMKTRGKEASKQEEPLRSTGAD